MTEATEFEMTTKKPGPDTSLVAHQTAIGGSWMVGARLVTKVIDLGTMLVLAHVLTPKDFGLVAIAMTLILIVEAALELPISQALVRLPSASQGHHDTAFTLSLLRGLALTTLICLISWPFAHFYGDSRLLWLVIALSFAPAARGLVSPCISDFSRNLDFSPDFTMEFTGKLVAFVTAVLIATTTRSYWAIAAGTIAGPVTGSALSYFLAPYRPRLSLKELPVFSGFLGWITAAQVVSAFNWQTDQLLLGKLTSQAELGLFSVANNISIIPGTSFFVPMMRPLHSAFSLLRDNPKRLASSYQSSATAVVSVGLPILCGMSLLATPMIRIMYGEQWLESANLLKWLALSLIPTLFAIPLGPLVMAFGRTQVFFRRNLFELCVKLPLIIVGAIRYHFLGVVVARCISETATVCFCMVVVKGMIGLSIRDQVLGPWRSLVAACLMVMTLSLSIPELIVSNAKLALTLETVATALIGAITYVTVLFGLWIWAGRPSGLEAMITNKLGGLLKRTSPPAPEAL